MSAPDGSAPPPPPPSQPPPAPPPGPPEVTDSLSLPQLRQLVSQFPKSEQRAYAFQYSETDNYETEIDEWFQYTEADQERDQLLASREAFETLWKAYCESQLEQDDISWIAVSDESRLEFLNGIVAEVSSPFIEQRIEALGCVYYVLTGAWTVTSGLDDSTSTLDNGSAEERSKKPNSVQLEWMHRGADLMVKDRLVSPLYAALLTATKLAPAGTEVSGHQKDHASGALDESEQRELSLCLSCFYLLTESARARREDPEASTIRQSLQNLSPSILVFLVSTISRLRWDESYNIPLIHAIQLLWKLLLLLFGDVQHDLEAIKGVLQPRVDPFSADASHPKLTASPLDYHMFRQEITSKYPAYNPPLPLIPLENEQRTILPVVAQNTNRADDVPNPASFPGTGTSSSIFHQPVHIATPAPSPPPSPIGPGGKTGKKQNYQTNQNFPFLYPPLDTSSNDLGGRGSTELQDLMVGKKWDGSDVPTSIIEAGELFASRMRVTRGMRQLWKQRDLFMKYDRGWKSDEHTDVEEISKQVAEEQAKEMEGLDDPDLRSRMDAVEHFFHHSLADMQSFVIVLMKAMLSNVQDIAVRNGNFADPHQSAGLNRTKSNSNVGAGQTLPMPPPPPKPAELSLEELDNIRSREISQKAIAGVVFSLLKWLKVSHVLKFEYLTQLLLDSNYVQLTLKYFAHQNLEDLVAFRYDRDDLSFFRYCHLHSDHPPLSPTSPGRHSDSGSVDDAIPPPIQRRRQQINSIPTNSDDQSSQPAQDPSSHPTVDELGHPLQPLPTTPLPTFSSRQFQTSIHLLRTLQKLTRGKSHRVLLLVQFKSSQILRRVLRVPDSTLRLYVLKLFKSQVPYCPKKWRQSNMRVITAIYLHCRPELRDEWLAGMHESAVDGELEEAVPLEWALRGLTFWWMRRWYRDVMALKEGKKGRKGKGEKGTGDGVQRETGEEDILAEEDSDDTDDEDEDGMKAMAGGQEIEEEERGFFQRELDAMGWGLAGLNLVGNGIGDEVAFGEEAPGVGSGGGAANGADNHVWANAASLEQWQNER
ncbi:Factor arrest protein 11 [Cyphellophora attinorum]|uniref:Factor arrest protein 11 n=1 Tax=Cyphellophora attinorum TaxID=1664694 RepID=A0A0N0NJB3_9EURO|nr:Factor arrest protein 11 [Phialophora attinorum]KPI36419.1 Factor arrest protein 11 [Phialophora attinorum]